MKRMKNMKIIIAVVLIMCCLSGCAQFNDAIGKSTEKNTSTSTDDANKNPDNPSEDDSFSVSLVYDGEPYIPSIPMSAQWTDGSSFHEAAFDKNGIAKIDGLDGDYKVTLSDIPEGYTYNPNIHVTTNRSKNITIELYKYTKPRVGGGGLYNCIKINKLTVYRAELVGPSSVVYFEFTPSQSGTYSIESWTDITQNNVNPLMDEYNGMSAAKYFRGTVDGGGISSTYTKNFKHEIRIDQKMVGNTFTFAVRAESETDFPVNIDFAVQLDGGFKIDWTTSVMMIPEVELKTVNAPSGAKLMNPEIEISKGKYRFDGSLYGLNEDDGYYHRYNEATGKYDGELLFAYITSACRFLELPFTAIEYVGNSALTVTNGTENYKFFIEGGKTRGYFCVNNAEPVIICPCIKNGCGGVCVNGCRDCLPECRTVTAEQKELMMKYGGYADHANNDGMCPVTEELKDFLQKFSVSQRYFNDGNGWVENNGTIDIDSLEDDQWLFACAYYQGFTNLP